MKFPSSLILIGCLCASLPLAAAAQAKPSPATAPAAAAPAGPSKIGIINIQKAILSTQEGKKLAAQLNARFAPRIAEINNEKKQIDALQKQLADGGNTMSAGAKSQLTQEIATKQRDSQQTATNAQSDYQNAQTDLMNTVGTKMMPLLQQYAKQHGYTAIVDVSLPWPQSPVLYFNPGTEITDSIIRLYDQAHPAASAPAAKPGSRR
jgi:outer membrane protein